MSRDDIRKALPMLDDAGVDLMISTGVSVPLIGSVVAALRQHGHVMPTNAADMPAAASRTITAVAGLVNAFEGRDPFGGLPVAESPQVRAAALKQQLLVLSPVAHADEYRSLFDELVRVEAEVIGQREALEATSVAPVPAARSCEVLAEYEVHVNDLAAYERVDPHDVPIRIVVGHLSTHLPTKQEEAIVRAAYWRSRVTLAGSGPGLRWLQESVGKRVDELFRSDAVAARYP